jgi:desulfoferrodoxin (superoxide reductase-like protein)
MPGYEGVGQAKLLRENSQVFLWQNDTVAASAVVGSLSLAVQLERVRSVHYPWGFSVEVAFSGDPGVFEVDVMVADTDTPNHYIQWTNITQVNATNVGRVDVLNSWAKYVALYMKTLPNAVTVTGQITR